MIQKFPSDSRVDMYEKYGIVSQFEWKYLKNAFSFKKRKHSKNDGVSVGKKFPQIKRPNVESTIYQMFVALFEAFWYDHKCHKFEIPFLSMSEPIGIKLRKLWFRRYYLSRQKIFVLQKWVLKENDLETNKSCLWKKIIILWKKYIVLKKEVSNRIFVHIHSKWTSIVRLAAYFHNYSLSFHWSTYVRTYVCEYNLYLRSKYFLLFYIISWFQGIFWKLCAIFV